MAKDYLNIIERALMMGISDKLNAATGPTAKSTSPTQTDNIYVYGQFPETEELNFPAVVVQLVASGFAEKYMGDKITFGASSEGSGEAYGCTYLIHLFVDRDTSISIGDDSYKQRRLINWLMLNIANSIMEIDWSIYEEEELEILERNLAQWRDIGYMPQAQWHGATAEFELFFLNLR